MGRVRGMEEVDEHIGGPEGRSIRREANPSLAVCSYLRGERNGNGYYV